MPSIDNGAHLADGARLRTASQELRALERRHWLGKLQPPVLHQESSPERALSLLPKPLWELYLYLTDKEATSSRLMLPACIRETVTVEIGRGPLPSSFFYTGPSVGAQTIKRAEEVRGGKKELDTLKELLREAARSGAKDLEWGEKVRIPLVCHTIHSFWPKFFGQNCVAGDAPRFNCSQTLTQFEGAVAREVGNHGRASQCDD